MPSRLFFTYTRKKLESGVSIFFAKPKELVRVGRSLELKAPFTQVTHSGHHNLHFSIDDSIHVVPKLRQYRTLSVGLD